MTKIKIGTLNCQNNEDNRLDRNNHAYILADHILNEQYDILGLQELTISYTKKINSYLKKHKFYGAYQYGKGIFGTRFPIIKSFNQSNKIVTLYNINSTRTYALPWIPYSIKDLIKMIKKCCLTRRTLTEIELTLNNDKIYVFNTHLDYYIPRLQQRQLNYLLKKIYKYQKKGKIVIMGDFNLHINDKIFKDFIKKLDDIDIVRVPVDSKTNASHYKDTTAIDHIFIPREWKMLDYGLISDDIDSITDHKAIYVDVSID